MIQDTMSMTFHMMKDLTIKLFLKRTQENKWYTPKRQD
jgi:hypothetical protein